MIRVLASAIVALSLFSLLPGPRIAVADDMLPQPQLIGGNSAAASLAIAMQKPADSAEQKTEARTLAVSPTGLVAPTLDHVWGMTCYGPGWVFRDSKVSNTLAPQQQPAYSSVPACANGSCNLPPTRYRSRR